MMLHDKDETLKVVTEEKEIALERAQSNLAETTARVNSLAKHNGLLRAQYEQLKVQFNGEKSDFSRQLARATKVAKDAEELKQKNSSLEKRLAEKERKLGLVSKELVDRTSFAEKVTNGMNEKDAVLSEVRSKVEEMKARSEEVESSHYATVTKLESKLAEMSEELNMQATESDDLHEENVHAKAAIEVLTSRIEEISTKLKEESDQHKEDLHNVLTGHKKQLAESLLDRERVLKQLSDSKQITESTTSELHSKLSAVKKELDQKRESEKHLLQQMSERERDLRRENEKIHQTLTDATSNKTAVENNFQQIQQCLFDTTEKVEMLEAELKECQLQNVDLTCKNEEFSMKLEGSETKCQDFITANAQNRSCHEALMTESQELRLNLSELTRSAGSKEQYLRGQIQQQKADFDIELSGLKKSAESKEQHLNSHIQQLRSDFDREGLKYDEEIADSKVFIQNLMKQLETGSNESSEVYKQNISKLEFDLTTIEGVIQKMRQDKEQMLDSLKICEGERDALACDNDKLGKRLESAQEDTKKWMQTSRVASSELKQLKLSFQSEKKEIEAECEKHRNSIEHLTLERDALKSELLVFCNTSEAEKHNLETKLRHYEEDLSVAKSAIEEQAGNGSLMIQVIELEDKLRQAKREAGQQEESLQGELSRQSHTFEHEMSNLRVLLSESIKEKEECIVNMLSQIEDKQSAVQNLTSVKGELSSKVQEVEDDLSRKIDQVSSLTKEIESINKELNLTKDVLARKLTTENTTETLKDQLSEALSDIQVHKERADNIMCENSNSVQIQIKEMQATFKESVAEKEMFIEKLQQEIEDKQDTIDNLARDNQGSKQRLTDAKRQIEGVHVELEGSKAEVLKQRDLLRSHEDASQSKNEDVQQLFKESIAEKEAHISKLQKEINSLELGQQVSQSAKEEVEIELNSLVAKHTLLKKEMQESSEQAKTQLEDLRGTHMKSQTDWQRKMNSLKLNNLAASKDAEHIAALLKEEVAWLEVSRKDLVEQEEITKSTLEETRTQLQQLQQLHSATKMEQQKLVQTMESVSKKLHLQLEDRTRKTKSNAFEHRVQLENLEKMLADNVADNEIAIAKLTKLWEEKSAAFDSLTISYEVSISESKSTSEQNSNLMHRLQQEMKNLQESEDSVATLKASIAGREKEMVVLKGEVLCLSEDLSFETREFKSFKEKSEMMEISLKEEFEVAQSTLEDSLMEERLELSLRLDEAHKSISQCRKQLKDAKDVLGKRETYIEEMNEKVAQKEDTISTLSCLKESEVSKLKDLLLSLQKELEGKIVENKRRSEEHLSLQESVESSKHNFSNLESALQNARREVASMTDDINGLLADLVRACKSLKLKNDAIGADPSIDEAREMIRCLREAVKSEHSNAVAGLELANSREKAVSRLERTLNAKERDIQSLHRDVDKFKASITDTKNRQLLTKSRNSELEIKMKSIESEKASIQQKWFVSDELAGCLRQEKAEFEIQVSRSASELQELRSVLSVAQTTVSEYELKLMVLGEAKEQASEQVILIKSLRADLEDVATEMEYMMQQNESLEKQVEFLQKKLHLSESDANSVHAKCVLLEKELVEKESEIWNLESRNSALYDENLSLLETIDGYDEDISDLNQGLASVEDRIVVERSNFEAQIRSQKRIATILEKHLSTRSEELNSLRQTSASDSSKLGRELKERISAADTLRSDLNEIHSKLALASEEKKIIEEMQKKSEANADGAINTLRSELAGVQSKLILASEDKERIENSRKQTEAATISLRSELAEVHSKLDLASKDKERIENLQKETETAANDAINLLEQKDYRIADLLNRIGELESSKSAMVSTLAEKETILDGLSSADSKSLVEINRFKTIIKAKTKEIIQLNDKIGALNRAVTTSHNRIERCENQRNDEKEKYQEQVNEVENAYQDAKARLYGCEKLATIHDKECTRLLNDIESKSEQIHSLTQKVESLEANQEELYSNTNELEGCLATQRDIISTLEEELLEKSNEISAFEEDEEATHFGDIEELKECVKNLEGQLEDRETELELLLDNNKDISGKLAEAKFKLDASEEEVQLLCESIEEKERVINQFYEAIERVKVEKAEAVSLLSDMQIRGQQQDQDHSKSPLHYLHDADDGISLRISRPSLSPTASEIIHKHSELLNDLVKMKSAIHDAMSPSKSLNDSSSSIDGSISIVKLLQQELDEKNLLLCNMGQQVDYLMHDIKDAKTALSGKEDSVQELTISLQQLEGGQADLKKKLKSRKAYIKQLEDALSHEVKHRRDMENTLSSAQKEKKALAVEYQSKTEELESAQKEIKKKDHAVAEQMNVARNLAKQLQTTKQKIYALKHHLQQEGLLKDFDGNSPPNPEKNDLPPIPYHSPSRKSNQSQHYIPDINATMSNDSLNWSVSDDDEAS
jgi:chromosome segregation ATPase